MGAVNRNLQDMPMPDFAYPDRHDGRVFIYKYDDEGNRHKQTIGHLTVSTPNCERMIPNSYFRDTYQNLFKENYPTEKIPFHEISIGMYALTLGIGIKTELYSILQNVYGVSYVNSILDYAMFCIMYRSDVTQIYENVMEKRVLFADKLYSDSWYSDFFSRKITEDQHHQFRIQWIKILVSRGLKKVWLSIDGSNDDCEARRSFLAQFGFPKSHNLNKTIVGYMYAVDAETGRPVTYFTYEGSVPDCQAFQKMATFLDSFNIEIEGVILDCGFAVDSVFETIQNNSWKYVVMLPNDAGGHKEMLKEYGETIRWKTNYLLENVPLFGISGKKRIYAANDRTSDICLFFNGASGSDQSTKLLIKMQAARRKINQAITNGKRASVPSGLKKYITIEGEGYDRKVVFLNKSCDSKMAQTGFFSMAVSEGICPDRAQELYSMRDTSETQYCILKSQQGGKAARVHKTEGIYSKFALLFISSIIRFEIEAACKTFELDTNPTIQSLDHVALLYTAQEEYESVRNLSVNLQKLFEQFDVDQDYLERLAREYNKRKRTDAKNPDRRIVSDTPIIHANSHKKGRRASQEKTEAIDNPIPSSSESSPVKSKGGRPKGKKDSKPRKPRSDKGKSRPKSSKN